MAGNLHAAPLLDRICTARAIAGYCAIPGEPDVTGVLAWALERNVMTSLPCLPADRAGDRVMIFRQWQPGDTLVQSGYGFSQPPDSAPTVTPDLMLVPLVGFDRAFNRLGQGAGDYDRAFAAFPGALRIGIAWSVQEVGSIPVDPWDVPLDAILTEREWLVSNTFKDRAHG